LPGIFSRKKVESEEKEKKTEEIQEVKQSSILGRQLIFEDTGLPIGVIKREIRSADGLNVISYEVEKAGNLMQFPAASIKITSEGVFFVPIWYVETQEFLRELEYQASIMPEFVQLLSNNELDIDRLLSVIEQTDPKLKSLIEESAKLKETISKRLSSLELEKLRIKKEMALLQNAEIAGRTKESEKQRGELLAREKSVDLNANRCREILQRLSKSPFVPKTPIKARVEYRDTNDGFPRARKYRVLEVEKNVEELKEQLGNLDGMISYTIDARLQIFKNELLNALSLESAKAKKEEIAAELEELKALKADAKTEPTFSNYIKKRIELLTAIDSKQNAKIEELNAKLKESRASEIKNELKTLTAGKCKICDAVIPAGITKCPSCGVAVTEINEKTTPMPPVTNPVTNADTDKAPDEKVKLVKKVKAQNTESTT